MSRFAKFLLSSTILSCLPTAYANGNLGATAFKEVCAVCHGAKGEGTSAGPTQAPPIKGSAFVKSSSPDELKALIKFGRTGASKRFKEIPLGMPAQALSDAEMAAIIPYLQVELQK